ncbi:prolyl oligopeptidase family serine peptidase [Novosphingobium sp. KACC 22771]|uniref:prolyl oligopeptidase family serine peptidase n=1 Tax=Novosphingobium sp. KACC 22771 TaxID=3025670 RepID=UPI002365D98C|nr:prolyl oligopeptidase family serine peptidase [Novosphingobium sp. KACC 22771]WDF74226.1 prolyl oligopeptidase family serine peptidase [Novosphingobium sp. KACC 22771]
MHKITFAPIAALLAMGAAPAIAGPDTRTSGPPSLQDLVAMRSLDSVTISSDGRSAAFRVITPSLESNSVSVEWLMIEIAGKPKVALPLGHASLPLRQPMFDSLLDGQAQWAQDSQALYVQTLRDGRITINRIAPNGVDKVAISDDADIETFKILPGGRQAEIGVRAARRDIDQAMEQEHREGLHADRSLSLEGSRLTGNFLIGNRWSTIRYAGKGNSAREAFSGELRQKLVPLPGASRKLQKTSSGITQTDPVLSGSGKDAAGRTISSGRSGMTARLVQTAPPAPFLLEPTYQVVAQLPDGSERRCTESFCFTRSSALRSVSWNREEHELIIAHEEDYSTWTVLYGWKPETGQTRLIRAADGSLDGGSTYSGKPCSAAGKYLLCVHAGPTSPPRLVRIDTATGETITLFDPNPVLRRRAFNPARFLTWRSSNGDRFTGFLVLPPHANGSVPLVITSYRCRGLLRGGFTSLAPEQLLTQRGMAALCVNHNNSVGMKVTPDGKLETLGPHLAAIAGYKAIIDQLADAKLIDPARVGLAGHSFTSMVGAYALSHTDMFKSVVIGTGITIDPATLMFIDPVRHGWNTSLLNVLNVPHPLDDREGRWKDISPALNAAQVKGSLLIQTPENEYLSAVQLFSAIQHAGGASDMYIFPNEGHLVTREPAHQLSRMRRSVDWFDFWLLDHTSVNAANSADIAHWKELRSELPPSPSHEK